MIERRMCALLAEKQVAKSEGARPRMRLGEEHCRDDSRSNGQADHLKSSIGIMRRRRAEEHANCTCGGTWRGDSLALVVGKKLLEHLICSPGDLSEPGHARVLQEVQPSSAVTGDSLAAVNVQLGPLAVEFGLAMYLRSASREILVRRSHNIAGMNEVTTIHRISGHER